MQFCDRIRRALPKGSARHHRQQPSRRAKTMARFRETQGAPSKAKKTTVPRYEPTCASGIAHRDAFFAWQNDRKQRCGTLLGFFRFHSTIDRVFIPYSVKEGETINRRDVSRFSGGKGRTGSISSSKTRNELASGHSPLSSYETFDPRLQLSRMRLR